MLDLDAILADHGLTKKELADRLGKSKQGVNAMKNPTLANLEKIAKALDIPLWRLFGYPERDNLDGKTITIDGMKYRLTRVE